MKAKHEELVKKAAAFSNATSVFVASWYRNEITPTDIVKVVPVIAEMVGMEKDSHALNFLEEWILGWEEKGSDSLPYQSSGSEWTAWFDEDSINALLENGESDEDFSEARELYSILTTTFRRINPNRKQS